jgi:hypothetical protein
MDVPTEELFTKVYTVRSFHGAVHVVCRRSMPQGRSLAEYILIVTLLRTLLERFAAYFHAKYNRSLPNGTISALVTFACHPSGTWSPLANAVVGFTAFPSSYHRLSVVHRRRNLPILNDVQWSVDSLLAFGSLGVCAESETFPYLEAVVRKLRGSIQSSSRVDEAEIIAVSLRFTLNNQKIKHKRLCPYCVDVAKTISEHLKCKIIDIAPGVF